MNTTGTLFIGNTKPVVTVAADGQFVLSLFAVHNMGYLKKEPYQIVYTGAEAQQFWQQHQNELTSGQPLYVNLVELRAHTGGRSGAQICAKATALRLLPRAGQASAQAQPITSNQQGTTE